MAKRPILQKKLARLRKSVNRQPLPVYIDLVDWLQTRGHATSNRKAVELLKDGKVKAGSHTVGRTRLPVQTPLTALEVLKGTKAKEPTLQWVAQPLVRAAYCERLTVEK